MPPRRSRFQPPVPPPRQQPEVYRTLEPTAGINRSRPAEHLKPNEAVASDNFTFEGGFIRVRSGITRLGDTSSGLSVAGTFQLLAPYTADSGVEYLIAVSNGSVIVSAATSPASAWSGSDIKSVLTGAPSSATLSSATTSFLDWTQIYDSEGASYNLGQGSSGPKAFNILVVTDGVGPPVVLSFDTSGTDTLIHRSELFDWNSTSGYSTVHYCATFDDRLIFFNTWDSAGSHYPRRVWWSDRGRPARWGTGSAVAGLEDLANMRGVGTGLGVDAAGQRMYIFSNREVWQAIPRRDIAAFDFDPIYDGDGCPFEATITETPFGVFFMGSDMQLYLASNGQVRPVGDKVLPLLRDDCATPSSMKGAYDPEDSAFVLLYSDTANGYPNRALRLSLEGGVGAWHEWSTTSERWQIAASAPCSATTQKRALAVAASDGSVYAFHSQQSTDIGRSIPAVYTTPPLNQDYRGMLSPVEAWVEHESAHTSAFTLVHSVNEFSQSSTVFGGVVMPSTRTGTNFIPGTAPASRHPQFRLQMQDNVASKVGRVHIKLRPYSGRFPV